MKKLLFILVSIMILISCDNQERIDHINATRAVVTDSITGDHGMITEVHEFTYKGCQWISFEGNNRDMGFSVVHSPDCTNPNCIYRCNCNK